MSYDHSHEAKVIVTGMELAVIVSHISLLNNGQTQSVVVVVELIHELHLHRLQIMRICIIRCSVQSG